MSPTYILFYGTFIQLPARSDVRTASSSVENKHPMSLSIAHGVIWVLTRTGCIAGTDWNVASEEYLIPWIEKRGWSIASSINDDYRIANGVEPSATHADQNGHAHTVHIVKAREQKNSFFFPGFIDTHIHAPQYANAGLFGSSTLLDWLETYTFPLENSLGDRLNPSKAPPRAHSIYNRVISRTLAHGTTCASYFATTHVAATNLLASLCLKRGQRALIGRVCMDNPQYCPDYYRDESAAESITATEATIEYIHKLSSDSDSGASNNRDQQLVAPIVTPRFAPTCSSESLRGLGKLAASFNPPLRIQTHISENRNEVALVKAIFPDRDSYAHVYDSHGLLTPRTILAHGVHLTSDERALISSRKAKVSHCPASNSALGSGLCPVRTLLDDGITVGLGTDVSGGYSPSILEAVRQSCLVSRLVASGTTPHDSRRVLSVEESLYLATRGGAEVVDMADRIGGFEVGKCWDAQLIELGENVTTLDCDNDELHSNADSIVRSNVDIFGWESWQEKIHKWVWNGDDRNVVAVWVNGRLVHRS